MKKITTNDELKIGKNYLCRSKSRWDNHPKPDVEVLKIDITHDKKYLGDRIWAYDRNSQALEMYDIWGPIDLNDMVEDLVQDEENNRLRNK